MPEAPLDTKVLATDPNWTRDLTGHVLRVFPGWKTSNLRVEFAGRSAAHCIDPNSDAYSTLAELIENDPDHTPWICATLNGAVNTTATIISVKTPPLKEMPPPQMDANLQTFPVE